MASDIARLKADNAKRYADGLCQKRSCDQARRGESSLCERHLAEYSQARMEVRRDRRAKGICEVCGRRSAIEGERLCDRCRVRSIEYGRRHDKKLAYKRQMARVVQGNHHAWATARLQEGLCVAITGAERACANPVVPGYDRCQGHLDGSLKREAIQRATQKQVADRLARGVCTRCAWPMEPDRIGKFLCLDCTDARVQAGLQTRAQRRIDGLCSCGARKRSGFYRCWRCRKKARERAAERVRTRRNMGLCRSCPKQAWRPGAIYCYEHKEQARKTDLSRRRRKRGQIFRGAGARQVAG